jgi:hypothetical protein
MLFRKTQKGRDELKPGGRELGLRERGLLLLFDGHKTLADVQGFFNGEAEKVALSLVERGYLESLDATGLSFDTGYADMLAGPMGELLASKLQQPSPLPANLLVDVSPKSTAVSADSFNGKRSLATTRMFLFDICERMFARRDKLQAEKFREALREATDRESMLTVSREMMAEIERVAGPERADSISERIAMLLPSEERIS